VYSAGIVTFAVEGMTSDDAVCTLWDEDGILCRAAFQGKAGLISVSFFNTEAELEVLINAAWALAQGKGGIKIP
jgi:selenocysteine lyase/cysteine desulfurase